MKGVTPAYVHKMIESKPLTKTGSPHPRVPRDLSPVDIKAERVQTILRN
jgi:hypothetical protein